MPDGPMTRYRGMVSAGELRPDPAQAVAVEKLQLLHMRLRDYNPQRGKRVGLGWLGFGRREEPDQALTGLYLYGGVGRGKSMLMDLFYDGAPVRPKRRVHFHAFMAEVHVGVHIARETNVPDPIRVVAEEVAESATLLCFDEMQVTDITDAMILGRLFEALFERGVIVVSTSNRPPDDLYKDGLNRVVFEPFIEMLKHRLDVLELASPTDYRQGRATAERRIFHPLGSETQAAMDAAWGQQTAGANPATEHLTIGTRQIEIPLATERAGRGGFDVFCRRPLGPSDYLAIARRFEVFFLDDVPQLTFAQQNEAKRLVTLIDALYEARATLYLSAAVAPEEIYTSGKGTFEFARTASRLAEMNAADYPGG
ncbi:MAG: cell division protein ZapE [Pseudomonadota bacterium]